MHPADRLLTDRVAIVTGGGGGIGRAIAIGFARAGADVVIADIVPERCEETAERIRETGRRALPVPTDVSDTGQVQAMVEQAAGQFSRIDILVNNAGGVRRRPFLDQSERSWRRLIDLNLVSMLAATSAAVPVMIDGGLGGSVINIASIEASRAAPGFSVYAACKAGMLNFTRSLALELADHGIRVNAIAPGPIPTEGAFSRLLPSEQLVAERTSKIPAGRMGTPRELAQLAAFLVSDAADWIRGEVLTFDGGEWLRGAGEFNWMLEVEIPWDEMRRRGRREEKT